MKIVFKSLLIMQFILVVRCPKLHNKSVLAVELVKYHFSAEGTLAVGKLNHKKLNLITKKYDIIAQIK